jgi:asparagine synthase (glutamine-hydrolysing)
LSVPRALPPFSSAARSLHRRGADGLDLYEALISVFPLPQKRALLAPDLVPRDYDHLWALRRFWREDLSPAKRLQWLDLHTYLPDDLLVKADRASMAVSLEVRPPFFDHRLVEFALSLDASLLRRDGRDKWIRGAACRTRADAVPRARSRASMPVRRWVGDAGRSRRRSVASRAPDSCAAPGGRASAASSRSLLVFDRWSRHPASELWFCTRSSSSGTPTDPDPPHLRRPGGRRNDPALRERNPSARRQHRRGPSAYGLAPRPACGSVAHTTQRRVGPVAVAARTHAPVGPSSMRAISVWRPSPPAAER